MTHYLPGQLSRLVTNGSVCHPRALHCPAPVTATDHLQWGSVWAAGGAEAVPRAPNECLRVARLVVILICDVASN